MSCTTRAVAFLVHNPQVAFGAGVPVLGSLEEVLKCLAVVRRHPCGWSVGRAIKVEAQLAAQPLARYECVLKGVSSDQASASPSDSSNWLPCCARHPRLYWAIGVCRPGVRARRRLSCSTATSWGWRKQLRQSGQRSDTSLGEQSPEHLAAFEAHLGSPPLSPRMTTPPADRALEVSSFSTQIGHGWAGSASDPDSLTADDTRYAAAATAAVTSSVAGVPGVSPVDSMM